MDISAASATIDETAANGASVVDFLASTETQQLLLDLQYPQVTQTVLQ